MLTLSLDVMCDIICYPRDAAIKSTISKQSKLTFVVKLNNKVV